MPRDPSRAGRVRGTHRRPTQMTVPATFLVRVFLLASVAILGSVWALVRYYTHPHAPMRVTVSVDASAWDAGAGFIPAPELEVVPR